MPHIHTEPGQHDTTASAFIIVLTGEEPRLLLHEHLKIGKLLQYGGHVELSETPWEAVCREVREESGYDPAQLQVLQPRERPTNIGDGLLHPIPAVLSTHAYDGQPGHFHTDSAYAFVTSEGPKGHEAAGESAGHVSLTRRELEALSEDRIPENVQKIGLFIFSLIDAWQPVPVDDYK